MVIFPAAWITSHWALIQIEVETIDGGDAVYQHLINQTIVQTTFLPFDRKVKSIQPLMRVARLPGEDSNVITSKLFDPTLHHVIPSSVYMPKTSDPLQVVYIGASSNSSTYDVLLDSLERSAYIKVVAAFLYYETNSLLQEDIWHSLHPTSPSIVIVDWLSLGRDCHVLRRILSFVYRHDTLLQSPNVYLLLLDASASTRTDTCSDALSEIVPQEKVVVAKRSIVDGRRWNFTKQWVGAGQLIPNIHEKRDGGHILHWPGFVTETFVELLRDAIAKNKNERQVDVSLYLKATTSHDVHHFNFNHLRRLVSQQLNETRSQRTTFFYNHLRKLESWQLNETRSQSTAHDKKPLWVEQGGIDEQGRSDAPHSEDEKSDDDDEDYVRSLLSIQFSLLVSSKIVVVTQADEWEDHDNRLMEALASGGMVMCDSMVAPPKGLKHKSNIVFYDGPTELDENVRYYLNPANAKKREKIGQNGALYSLGRHRSWHVLELLLFGKAFFRTDKEPLTSKGPSKRKHSIDNNGKDFARKYP